MNTLEDFEDLACNPNLNLKFDDTLYHIANAELERRYNCTIPFLPAIISNKTGKPTKICTNQSTGFKAIKLYTYFRTGGISTISEFPCAGMDIFLGLPFNEKKGSDNWAYIKIYLKTTIKIKRTVFDYDFTTLVAELGGYSGLFLGLSVVQITIMITSFLVKIITKKILKRN